MKEQTSSSSSTLFNNSQVIAAQRFHYFYVPMDWIDPVSQKVQPTLTIFTFEILGTYAIPDSDDQILRLKISVRKDPAIETKLSNLVNKKGAAKKYQCNDNISCELLGRMAENFSKKCSAEFLCGVTMQVYKKNPQYKKTVNPQEDPDFKERENFLYLNYQPQEAPLLLLREAVLSYLSLRNSMINPDNKQLLSSVEFSIYKEKFEKYVLPLLKQPTNPANSIFCIEFFRGMYNGIQDLLRTSNAPSASATATCQPR